MAGRVPGASVTDHLALFMMNEPRYPRISKTILAFSKQHLAGGKRALQNEPTPCESLLQEPRRLIQYKFVGEAFCADKGAPI